MNESIRHRLAKSCHKSDKEIMFAIMPKTGQRSATKVLNAKT